MSSNSRILAIDYGTRRMGVAISDELRVIAQPLEFVPAEPIGNCIERLLTLVSERDVGLILVGMPRNMDGSYGPAAAAVREFVALLREQTPVPIKTLDERLTTVLATRALREAGMKGRRQREKVDQTAAAILLQDYLNTAA